MRKLKAILIDDERHAREELKRHLEIYTEFIIAGEAADADEAEEIINKVKPDVIFLDIQMPGRSGFDLLESLTDVPDVIFTTAFDHYAVKAFEINALDYLVKPIREERFAKAIVRVKERCYGEQGEEKKHSTEHSLFVKEGDRLHFIKIKSIYLIESSGNYARLHFNNTKVLIKRSLNQLEKTLDTNLFFRINRNEIINTSFAKSIETLSNGQLSITLQDGKKLTASTRQSVALKKIYR